MKLNKLIIAGISVMAFSSCSDYLDVDAPSKNDFDYVYADNTEVARALNGCYASLLSGSTITASLGTFCLNSDVDFAINNSQYVQSNAFRRFECDPDGSGLSGSWNAYYQGIEKCNIVIDNIPKSPNYIVTDLEGNEAPDEELLQMLGEAKVIRAIFYHELIWMFGDIPFSMKPSYDTDMIFPVTDRIEIIKELIADLEQAAESMKMAADLENGVERVSKEACWAMIARLAMTAGGYQLVPEGDTYGKMQRPANYLDFYKTAAEYAKKVIDSNSHSLNKPYYKVFVDECNFIVDNTDDPIFEIPYAKESTGNIGYQTGPAMSSNEGSTVHPYGKANSGNRLNSLYRFSFDANDIRRDYLNPLFNYSQTNVATLHNDRSVYNGKWSKLWVNGGLGSTSEDTGTGINYPYLRYTDVLLTYAEAVNEIENGLSGANGAAAQDAIAQVRNRAFPTTPDMVMPYITARTSKDDALKMILDERKWEFAGENMRWRDLVRNNLYAQEIYWTFLRYYGVAENAGQSSPYLEAAAVHDFGYDTAYDKLPYAMYYKNDQSNVRADGSLIYTVEQFPNQSVKVVDIVNPYSSIASNDPAVAGYSKADYFNWFDEGIGGPQTYFLYSLRGYIYAEETNVSRVLINNNGTYQAMPEPSTNPTAATLPPVRYILPYPRTAITHSSGQYVNKYGYK